jgi:arginine repressor
MGCQLNCFATCGKCDYHNRVLTAVGTCASQAPTDRLVYSSGQYISNPNNKGQVKMAKAAHGTKSQAIHEYLSANPNATANDIVAAMKQQGIAVSFGLAKAVKYGKKGKRSAAKRAAKAPSSNGKPVVSGSDSIRQFIAQNPAAGPKEIEAGLKAEGIKVSKHLISAVKYSKAKKKSGRKARRMARRAAVQVAARKTGGAVTVEHLLEIKRLADSIGGADQVRRALDTLEQLR